MFQKILIVIIVFFIISTAIFLVVRTLNFSTHEVKEHVKFNNISVPRNGLTNRLRDGLKIQTVSSKNPTEAQKLEYEAFLNYLEEAYPNIFQNDKIDFQRINDYALIIRWRSDYPNSEPVLFTGHYDVVGVAENTVVDWRFAPFGATVSEGKIYSRGTLDDKSSVFAHLEALDYLIRTGFRPQRDIVYAFSYNEEVGGNGADTMARILGGQNPKFYMVMDEGGRVLVDSETKKQTAYIGISEKGRAVVKITVRQKGGHASQPPLATSVTKMAQLINEFNSHPMKAKLTPQTVDYLTKMYGEYDFFTQMLIANKEILEPVLFWKLSQNPQDNARIRTTMAMTMLHGSDTINIIPEYAEMTADFRILPSESLKDIEDYIYKTAGNVLNTSDFMVERISTVQPSHISKTNSKAFGVLKNQIVSSFPDAKVLPFMVLAGTDARCYEMLSDNVYRFLPIALTQKELDLMHGVNEYISINNFETMTDFYVNLIRNNFDAKQI